MWFYLVESIISLNSKVKDLGEVNIFEESYSEYQKSKRKILSETYLRKLKTTTIKQSQQISGYLIINMQE